MHGTVVMHWREAGEEKQALLQAGDIFYAGIGCEHVHPDRRREQEDRLRAHARHYSTPSRFTAR